MGITIFLRKILAINTTILIKEDTERESALLTTRIFPIERTKLTPKTAWFSHWTQLLLVLPLLMVLPRWGGKQCHQGVTAVPPSPVGLIYTSGQSLQNYTQRNRTADWQDTGDSVCKSDTDSPSAGASRTKWPTSRFQCLTFPAESIMWMVWNNAKTPASLSVPKR